MQSNKIFCLLLLIVALVLLHVHGKKHDKKEAKKMNTATFRLNLLQHTNEHIFGREDMKHAMINSIVMHQMENRNKPFASLSVGPYGVSKSLLSEVIAKALNKCNSNCIRTMDSLGKSDDEMTDLFIEKMQQPWHSSCVAKVMNIEHAQYFGPKFTQKFLQTLLNDFIAQGKHVDASKYYFLVSSNEGFYNQECSQLEYYDQCKLKPELYSKSLAEAVRIAKEQSNATMTSLDLQFYSSFRDILVFAPKNTVEFYTDVLHFQFNKLRHVLKLALDIDVVLSAQSAKQYILANKKYLTDGSPTESHNGVRILWKLLQDISDFIRRLTLLAPSYVYMHFDGEKLIPSAVSTYGHINALIQTKMDELKLKGSSMLVARALVLNTRFNEASIHNHTRDLLTEFYDSLNRQVMNCKRAKYEYIEVQDRGNIRCYDDKYLGFYTNKPETTWPVFESNMEKYSFSPQCDYFAIH